MKNPIDELYDIYGIWHVPWWQTAVFNYTVIAGAVITLVVLVGIIIKKVSGKKKKLSADALALQGLQELRGSLLMQPEQAKQFYLSLSVILKTYFSEYYHTDVCSKTDDEMMMFLKSKMPSQVRQELQEVVHGGLFVKFAQETAVREQMECDMQRSIKIVEQTSIQK